MQARNSEVHRDMDSRLQEQRHMHMDYEHLKQANRELVQQIKIAHDSEERALDSKGNLENERNQLKQKVAALENERIARRTEMALERQTLLKEVADKIKNQAWMD